MPTIPNFVETLTKAIEIHKKKNDDYSGSFGSFFNFEFCDYVSSLFQNSRDKVYSVFVAVKICRLAVTLSSKTVNNESIEDSFDDLIVYSTIWKCDYMSRKKIELPHYCPKCNKGTNEQIIIHAVHTHNAVYRHDTCEITFPENSQKYKIMINQ